ncbi:hypothetical protein ACOSQ3_026602 [Xanthoceras sorbifolium]
MDLNQSIEISPSTPSPQVHNFMPINPPPFLLPNLHQATEEYDEEARNSHVMQKQEKSLKLLWNQQMLEIDNTSGFKNKHQLPLSTIKRIMKSNENVKCEFFREKDEEEARNSEFMQTQWMHLKLFWNQRMFEINHTSEVAFKNSHPLPLAKIKRIMKSNEAVKMVSAEAPVLFAKACEIFIMELTARAWMQTVGCNRRTLQRFDIAKALQLDKLFHFLFDAVPDLEKCRKNVAIAPLDLMLKPSSSAFEVNHESTSQTPEEIPQAPMIKPSYSASKFNGGSTSR